MKSSKIIFLSLVTLIVLVKCSLKPDESIPSKTHSTATHPSPTFSVSKSSTPINTVIPSLTPTDIPIPSATPTKTITPTPTPTKTVIGGFPGKYLLVSRDDEDETNFLTLHDANGDLIKVLYSILAKSEIVNDIGAKRFKNWIGRVKWSPDGGKYTMQYCEKVENALGKEVLQCQLNIYTSDGNPILNTPLSCKDPTDWSPDGKWIAYTHVGDNGDEQIRIVKSDGSQEMILVDRSQTVGYPKFSPDSSQVLYWVHGGQLRLVNIEGTDDHIVWEAWWGEGGYNWSPDGSKIVLSRMDGGLSNIFIVNPDGTMKVPVHQDYEFDLRGPNFSPDGNFILFYAYNPGVQRQPRRGDCYYTIPSDLATPPKLVGSGWDARWSPDSSYVILHGWPLYLEQNTYTSYDDVPYYAVKPDASGYIQLGKNLNSLTDGIWQPDSPASEEFYIPPISSYEIPPALSITPTPAYPIISDFEGVWINQNPEKHTIYQLEIRSINNKVLVRILKSEQAKDNFLGDFIVNDVNSNAQNLRLFWEHPDGSIQSDFVLVSPGRLKMINQIQNPVDIVENSLTSEINFMRTSAEAKHEVYTTCPPILDAYDPSHFPPIQPALTIQGNENTVSNLEILETLPIYDSFDNSTFNYYKWFLPEEFKAKVRVEQADGKVEFNGENSGNDMFHQYIDFKNFQGLSINKDFGFQARFRIIPSDESDGKFTLSLISEYQDGYWGFHCETNTAYIHDLLLPALNFHCYQRHHNSDIESQTLSYGVWHTLTMVYIVERKEIWVLLDDQMLGSAPLPIDLDVYSDTIYPKIGFTIWGDSKEGASLIVQFDEIRITQP